MLRLSLIEGLEAYNINLTNDQLNTFIEAAVKKPMNNGRNEVQKW